MDFVKDVWTDLIFASVVDKTMLLVCIKSVISDFGSYNLLIFRFVTIYCLVYPASMWPPVDRRTVGCARCANGRA